MAQEELPGWKLPGEEQKIEPKTRMQSRLPVEYIDTATLPSFDRTKVVDAISVLCNEFNVAPGELMGWQPLVVPFEKLIDVGGGKYTTIVEQDGYIIQVWSDRPISEQNQVFIWLKR